MGEYGNHLYRSLHLLRACYESNCNAGDLSLIPGSGRSSGEGNSNPLQYSCLENPMDRGAWQSQASENFTRCISFHPVLVSSSCCNKYQRLGGLNSNHLFLAALQAGRPKIKRTRSSCFVGGCSPAEPSLDEERGKASLLLYSDTLHTSQRPLSPNTITLEGKVSVYEFQVQGAQSAQSTSLQA